jgi:hypothetical protein
MERLLISLSSVPAEDNVRDRSKVIRKEKDRRLVVARTYDPVSGKMNPKSLKLRTNGLRDIPGFLS